MKAPPAATLGLAGAIVAADQLSKAAIRACLPLHGSREVIAGVLDLTHVQNTGAAFGILNTVDFPYKTAILALVAACAMVGIALFAGGLSPRQRLARFGLALIMGGAAGNLVDRVTVGYVIDFVDVYWRNHHFWAFNVADSAITVGVIAMGLDMLGIGHGKPDEGGARSPDP